MSKHYAVLGTSAPVTTVKVGVRSVPAPFTGQLVHLVFSVGSPNTHGASTFDVKRNGVSIFATPEARPVIASGQRSVVVTGLEVSVSENDVISWDAVGVPLGGLAAPVTCTALLDDLAPPTVQVAEESGEAATAILLRVADGDLESLGEGEYRIKTASDVELPTTLPPNGAAGGDLDSDYPNPTVVGLQGEALPASAAASFIRRNDANTGWELATFGDASGDVAEGDDARFTDSRVPTGAAGGDVTGTFPDALVVSSIKARDILLPDIAGFIEDDFTDNLFNSDMWFRTSSSDVVEQSGKLDLRGSNFVQTANTFNFTNKFIQWQSSLDIWGRLHFDEDNYLEFRVRSDAGTIRFLLHTPGAGDVDQAGSISNSLGDWFKFEHQSGDGKVHFLTSPDGVTWTDRASTTPPITIVGTWMRWFGLDASFSHLDNITSNILSADAITLLDKHVITWVNANNRFELKPLPPNAVPVVSSAPSGAPAGHVAGFSEMRYDVVNHKLHIWNQNTSAWDWKSIDNS